MKKDDGSAAGSEANEQDPMDLSVSPRTAAAMAAANAAADRENQRIEEAFGTPQQQQPRAGTSDGMDVENVRSALKRDREETEDDMARLRAGEDPTARHSTNQGDRGGYEGIGPTFSDEDVYNDL